jgi:hypothetical protein
LAGLACLTYAVVYVRAQEDAACPVGLGSGTPRRSFGWWPIGHTCTIGDQTFAPSWNATSVVIAGVALLVIAIVARAGSLLARSRGSQPVGPA